jgi:F-type H+-transporting ATPase subunit gamma
MAKTRFIRKRILSVRNIHKITRTMEKVAQSKVMKLTGRFAHARSFSHEIARLIPVAFGASIPGLQAALVLAPLSAPRQSPRRILLLSITSNRGLCGGYNSHVLQSTRGRMSELAKEGKEPFLAVIGKKGMAYFRFYNQPVLISLADPDENISFGRTGEIAEDLMGRFLHGELDGVEIISTRFRTKVLQEIRRSTLLPFNPFGMIPSESGQLPPYLIEPSSQAALDAVLPMAVKVALFEAILEAFLGEYAQRAIAMHSASDNAQSMIKRLTLQYNRARQAQITSEMIEIIGGSGGAAAHSGEGSRR